MRNVTITVQKKRASDTDKITTASFIVMSPTTEKHHQKAQNKSKEANNRGLSFERMIWERERSMLINNTRHLLHSADKSSSYIATIRRRLEFFHLTQGKSGYIKTSQIHTQVNQQYYLQLFVIWDFFSSSMSTGAQESARATVLSTWSSLDRGYIQHGSATGHLLLTNCKFIWSNEYE